MGDKQTSRTRPDILVVEDERIYYEWLKFMWPEPNFTWVDNGKKAVNEIMERCHYDAIIMNVKMPVMNGFEATPEIRKLHYQRPIIGWSAHMKAVAEQACLHVGMNIFVERQGRDLGVGEIVAYLKDEHLL